MPSERDELAPLMGRVVIVDTATRYVYVGTLKDVGEHYLILADVDVHDTAEGRADKDLYAVEIRRSGVQPNRREAYVRKAQVASLSKLEDVVAY